MDHALNNSDNVNKNGDCNDKLTAMSSSNSKTIDNAGDAGHAGPTWKFIGVTFISVLIVAAGSYMHDTSVTLGSIKAAQIEQSVEIKELKRAVDKGESSNDVTNEDIKNDLRDVQAQIRIMQMGVSKELKELSVNIARYHGSR